MDRFPASITHNSAIVAAPAGLQAWTIIDDTNVVYGPFPVIAFAQTTRSIRYDVSIHAGYIADSTTKHGRRWVSEFRGGESNSEFGVPDGFAAEEAGVDVRFGGPPTAYLVADPVDDYGAGWMRRSMCFSVSRPPATRSSSGQPNNSA